MKPERIHFIGICGVAMGALAVAFQKKGWRVTGSDKGFYPPVSTHLEAAGVSYYPGWHVDKMIAEGAPDLVVVGNVAGSQNPELLYVKQHGLPHLSYPEVVAAHIVKSHSLVCAGTYGKTSSTALMTWILKHAGMNPSYMFGGLSLNKMSAAEITDSEWSVLEGDEYKTSGWDIRPKFSHYSPTHLLLTSVVWDHADVYPTEASYRDTFQRLIDTLPSDGLLVVSEKVPRDMFMTQRCNTVTYGINAANDYRYANVRQTHQGVSFDITHENNTHAITASVLGEYMADNITGCFAVAREIGIEANSIIQAIESFAGLRRRLEKRLDGPIMVFDDIAHSPSKASAVLKSMRSVVAGKVIAVFEPNTGNRQQEAVSGYDHAFQDADIVCIPRLTKLKYDALKTQPLDGNELTEVIKKTHMDVRYLYEDSELVKLLLQTAAPGDAIVFLGSHGFRGMIEEICTRLTFLHP